MEPIYFFATLALVLVGFELQLFDEKILNGTILMILVTSMVSSFVVQTSTRNIALQEDRINTKPKVQSERIMVSISNPNTINQLMELAILIKSKESKEPIYPLTIIQDSEDTESKLTQSKKMLSEAIEHLSSADISLQLISRIDLNPAGGILHAMRETEASELIMGWNGKVSTGDFLFGSVIDKLLKKSTQMIYVTKTTVPLNTLQRIHVVVPQYAEVEDGFEKWLNKLHLLTGRLYLLF